ncbi:hypothetical protein [Vampirovibrio chlorellavorus]|uniref:hypothetical protein n=1 Tax=Vampirovibrio chlorellavorus TaxID=758823 RepID=UPI0026F13CC8|nr:hypothetical protein [Vampirovibrio chlorellavorus]
MSSLFYESALNPAAHRPLRVSPLKGRAAHPALLLQSDRIRRPQQAQNIEGQDTSYGFQTLDPLTFQQSASSSQSFSVFRAVKETVKGALNPIVTMVKHPFKTAVALAGTVALTAVAPITIPIMVAAGLATGGWQVLKGLKTAVSEAKQGNYTASEKAFGHIGEGGFALVSSLLGVRQAGSVAAEAKAARLSLSDTASATEKLRAVDQGLKAAVNVQNGTWQNALKQTLSVFSPEGLKSTGAQLNPKRLTQLLAGKLQHWRAQFSESPVVPLEGPLAKAQRFLKLKDAEMPEIQQNLIHKEGVDFSGSAHGFYDGKNHSLHVEPDRLKAFRSKLAPFLRPWLDQLPQPLQTFLGNRYKQTIPVQEVVTHELTHARQFNQVASLTREQALQTLTRKFPGSAPQALEAICDGLRFHGNGSPATQQAGHRLLTQIAEHRLTQSNLREIQREGLGKMNPVSHLKTQLLSLKTYIRAGFEVEARQKAAETGIAQIAQQMGQTRGLFEEGQLLSHYKTLKVEAKLNKLLGRLNSTSPKLTPERNGQTRQQLQHWLNLPKAGSLTQGYLRQEQKLLRTTERLNRVIQWTETLQKAKPPAEQASQAQWSLKVLSHQVSHWAKGLLNSIKRFFTPAGLQRFEQKHHSLKGSYVQSAQTLIQASAPAESAA